MKNNVFLPEKVKVGFNLRNDEKKTELKLKAIADQLENM